MKRKKISFTEEQWKIIKEALRIYMQLGIGQIEHIHDLVPIGVNVTPEQVEKAKEILMRYKNEITGLDANSSHSLDSNLIDVKIDLAEEVFAMLEMFYNVK